jgi:hypothetical protein
MRRCDRKLWQMPSEHTLRRRFARRTGSSADGRVPQPNSVCRGRLWSPKCSGSVCRGDRLDQRGDDQDPNVPHSPTNLYRCGTLSATHLLAHFPDVLQTACETISPCHARDSRASRGIAGMPRAGGAGIASSDRSIDVARRGGGAGPDEWRTRSAVAKTNSWGDSPRSQPGSEARGVGRSLRRSTR